MRDDLDRLIAKMREEEYRKNPEWVENRKKYMRDYYHNRKKKDPEFLKKGQARKKKALIERNEKIKEVLRQAS